jgi:Putative Tad-like Flp pilus-assembly
VTMASGYPQLICMSTASTSSYSLPPCTGPDNANAIVVQQQATVPLILGGLFGKSTTTVSATATAGAGGGTGIALDVMLILDTTASMNTSDTSCSVSGATRVVCAEAGARTLLQQFKPSLVDVGLMVFPGVSSSTASKDYDCSSSTQPTILKYNASPQYQIVGLSSDYKTSDTATSLNTSSNLVIALGGGTSSCNAGLAAVGGVGTYYADVITAAQSALTANGRTGVQKVIIFLSDGDASASSSNMPTGKASNQCHEGINAAAAATSAGTKVYSLAYGAQTSGTCSTDSPTISACQAMQQIASTSAMFYSDTQNGSSGCTSSVNSVSELVAVFNQVGSSLTTPRLLPNGTT